MDREEILKKIEAVRNELAEDQFEIVKDKIVERKFHHHKSARKWFIGRVIEALRRKLMREIEFILEPVFNNQKEINLRLLEEVKKLKKEVADLQGGNDAKEHGSQNQDTHPEDQH